MPSLLAVDLGLRMGLARYDSEGRLVEYGSTHFSSLEKLKRGAFVRLAALPDLEVLVVEGDALLGQVWRRLAEKRGARALSVRPEVWRERLLLPREQRTGAQAKKNADALAREVIAWSGAKRPTSLRHDAAEAICIGLWGVLEVGWLEALPVAVSRRPSTSRKPPRSPMDEGTSQREAPAEPQQRDEPCADPEQKRAVPHRHARG